MSKEIFIKHQALHSYLCLSFMTNKNNFCSYNCSAFNTFYFFLFMPLISSIIFSSTSLILLIFPSTTSIFSYLMPILTLIAMPKTSYTAISNCCTLFTPLSISFTIPKPSYAVVASGYTFFTLLIFSRSPTLPATLYLAKPMCASYKLVYMTIKDFLKIYSKFHSTILPKL